LRFGCFSVALVLALLGCGDDEASRSKPAPAGPAATPAKKQPVKKESAVDLTPRPPELDAQLTEHGKTTIERGFEPAECPEPTYAVHEIEAQGKFYIEPDTQDAIKKQMLSGVAWEPHLLPMLERYVKPGTTVIDVGAHIGTHVVKMAELAGPDGHVVAFEPQPKMFDELRCNLRLNEVNNATALRVALGDTFGEIEMDAPNPKNEGGIGVGTGGAKAPLVPLDSYAWENVSVIKIDVEGFEDHVIEGARRTIEEHHPVLFVEIMGGQNWDTASPEVRQQIASTAHKITSMGYRVDRVGVFDYLAQPKGAPPPAEATRSPTGRKTAPTKAAPAQ
jgi:FkbM family methyltransferase